MSTHAIEVIERLIRSADDDTLCTWILNASDYVKHSDPQVRGRSYIIVGMALLEQANRTMYGT